MATPVTPNNIENSIADIRTRIPPPPPVGLRQVAETCKALGWLCVTLAEVCTAAEAAAGVCALTGIAFCVIIILEQSIPIQICKAFPEELLGPGRTSDGRDKEQLRKDYEQAYRGCFQAYASAIAAARVALGAAQALGAALKAAGRVAEGIAVIVEAARIYVQVEEALGMAFVECMRRKGFPNEPRPFPPAPRLPED